MGSGLGQSSKRCALHSRRRWSLKHLNYGLMASGDSAAGFPGFSAEPVTHPSVTSASGETIKRGSVILTPVTVTVALGFKSQETPHFHPSTTVTTVKGREAPFSPAGIITVIGEEGIPLGPPRVTTVKGREAPFSPAGTVVTIKGGVG